MKLPSKDLIRPVERAIIGVAWKPNPSMNDKAFRKVFQSSESVLQASCDGEEQLCIPLELIPTHEGWDYYFQVEQPNSWGYFMLPNPLPLERTRFDHPAWAIVLVSLNDMHDGHCWNSGEGKCRPWDSINCSCDCEKCARTRKNSENGQSEADWWKWAYSHLSYKAPEQLEHAARQLAFFYCWGMDKERVVLRLLGKDEE